MKTLHYVTNPSVLAFMTRAFWPSKGFKSTEELPHFEISQNNFCFTEKLCSEMYRLTQIPYLESLPIFFPHTMSFRLVMRMVTDPDFPEPIWNALQLRNEIKQFCPLRVNDTVNFNLKTHSYKFLEKGVEVAFINEARKDGVLSWQSVTTFYYRVAHGRPPDASIGLLPKISKAPTINYVLPKGGGLRFANLCGDFNGIHLFNLYAKMFDFKSAFLHPHRAVGSALAHIPLTESYPRELDLWFRGPISYGANAHLAIEKQEKQIDFAIYTDDPRPGIIGRLK
ncbi:MAG: hypothetical protein IT289_03515 [Oligoflexia bacterium]|nr:hypothetical protein [Oligoflexia bacterium]